MIDVEITRAQIARAPRSEISGILSCVYGALAAGEITEDEAAVLEAAGNLRRSLPPAPLPLEKLSDRARERRQASRADGAGPHPVDFHQLSPNSSPRPRPVFSH
ncbi:hypothetical protein MMSR116_18375 [Methylobacterium mesophilicum SR1.6/6]|uniref:Uncharacterized protein n=1 Tax=Methylobacterium mesophilicum SR1.6/6 TaxID=908290 RepID=A0A6B9FMK5_9HYPH|nr:hypothetical protein [Methylobacterium mesophilicum]QGY03637.1 hypothetical protein MMSR116_18375 [Methylobacterium mesophilicum SR1.6/6]